MSNYLPNSQQNRNISDIFVCSSYRKSSTLSYFRRSDCRSTDSSMLFRLFGVHVHLDSLWAWTTTLNNKITHQNPSTLLNIFHTLFFSEIFVRQYQNSLLNPFDSTILQTNYFLAVYIEVLIEARSKQNWSSERKRISSYTRSKETIIRIVHKYACDRLHMKTNSTFLMAILFVLRVSFLSSVF